MRNTALTQQKYLNLLNDLSKRKYRFSLISVLKQWKVNRSVATHLRHMGLVQGNGRGSKSQWIGGTPSMEHVRELLRRINGKAPAIETGRKLVSISEDTAIEILRRSERYTYSVTRTPKQVEAEQVL